MTKYFLGIDPSATSTGVTLLSDDGSEPRVMVIKPGKLRDADRLHYISTELKNFVGAVDVQLCVHESPSYGSTHKEFILGEALGAIKLTMAMLGIPVIGAAPTQLKKYLTGSGTASKAQMQTHAKKLGCPSDQEDICDSYSAALLCKDLLCGPQLKTRASREVAKLVRSKLENK